MPHLKKEVRRTAVKRCIRSRSRLRLIAGGFGGSALGGFLGTTCLLFGLALSLLLSAAGLLVGLALCHLLCATFGLLLGSHLLFFGGTAGLLLGKLHFGLLLTTRGFFRLALRHLLGAAFRFLLNAHLLLFGGTACDFLLLELHGFSLLPDAFGFRSSGLVGGHAFSRGTLLPGCDLQLLLRSGSFGLLVCFFSLGGGLVGGHALLLGSERILLLTLLHGGGTGLLPGCMHLSSFRFSKSSGGHLLCCHRLL